MVEPASFSETDHDMLIEMRADMRYARAELCAMRAYFEQVAATVERLDREAVTHPTLHKAFTLLTSFVVAAAAGLGVWVRH